MLPVLWHYTKQYGIIYSRMKINVSKCLSSAHLYILYIIYLLRYIYIYITINLY
jgi:hypothetical protein